MGGQPVSAGQVVLLPVLCVVTIALFTGNKS